MARKPRTGAKFRMVLRRPGRARFRWPNTASLTALRTCRSCVTASTSPSDFARRASMVLPVSIRVIACIGLTSRVKRAVPPRPGCRPSITSGKAEARAVDRDPRLAGERDFEAAAEAEAVDHGDARNFQVFEAVDHRMRPADGGLDGARIGGAAEFVDVGAGDEAGRLRRADDEAGRPLAFQRGQHGIEFLDHVGRQRIGAGAGAIEQQPGDAVGIARQLEIAIGTALLGLRPEFEHAIVEDVHDPGIHGIPTPSRSASRRPARRRCIRWRCRAWCRAASSH